MLHLKTVPVSFRQVSSPGPFALVGAGSFHYPVPVFSSCPLIPPSGWFLAVLPRPPADSGKEGKEKSNEITVFLIHTVIHHNVIPTQKIFG